MTNDILSDPELLARLVGFDSVSHDSNLPIADFISDYLDRPGVEIERLLGPSDDKVNLLVRVGPGPDPGRRGLVLSGHLDVVPAAEPEWNSDPFRLEEKDGRLIGRGASDMKGFVALAVNRAAATAARGAERPLVLILTCDEELGTLGARHLAQTYEDPESLPRSAVIGEPTSLRVVRLHKGHLHVRVSLHGAVAHSGYPHLGLSAIEPAGRVITGLAELAGELRSEAAPNAEYFPEVPYVALNIGVVRGGRAVNVVPDSCTIDVGARVLPGMDSSGIADRIRDRVRECTSGHPADFEVVSDSPPLYLGEATEINRVLMSEVGQTDTASVSYATDGGWLQTMGLECAVFGPGSIEVAHKPNEYISRPELEKGSQILERIVDRFCLEG